MSAPPDDLRKRAAAIRFREIGAIHAKAIARKMAWENLTLTDKEKEVIRDHIASLLMEVFTGATKLEPNHFQTAAASVGKEEVTEADMMMFAAKLDWAQKMTGRMLGSEEQKAVTYHVMTGSAMPVLTAAVPVHSLDCGRKYRGCAPDCPKQLAERKQLIQE